MTVSVERLPLLSASPGTQRAVTVHRFGAPGARPKVYLQAALHANELPGVVLIHHLLPRLEAAAARDEILGEIVVVPVANPIGLGQVVQGKHLGRYEAMHGANFNRGFPAIADLVAPRIDNRLTDDKVRNVALIRAAMREAVAEIAPRSELESLRKTLTSLAVDADIVLDLHCAEESLLFIYLPLARWPECSDLAAQMRCQRVLLWEGHHGRAFDEGISSPWLELAARFKDRPIPMACLGVTLELRGQLDATDALNAADAENLFRYLRRRQAIAGDPGVLPPLLDHGAPATGTDWVRAPVAGVVVHRKAIGDRVRKGEIVAEVIDPVAGDGAARRTPMVARVDGMVIGRDINRLVRPGDPAVVVSGDAALEDPEPNVD
ncbi:MAG: succinylglutamate desuccinylase/aspartoacylase family protein [Alphaproteobacteria bacterium]|nr:succinylglutamate desuccinylase/aspartoacylase family protein [Alphaproteobacteria bacterium]